jgi:hypothetical protein
MKVAQLKLLHEIWNEREREFMPCSSSYKFYLTYFCVLPVAGEKCFVEFGSISVLAINECGAVLELRLTREYIYIFFFFKECHCCLCCLLSTVR